MIDPNFWISEDISKLSIMARYIFIGMFSNADDEGRGRANTAYLKSIIFPYDDIRTVEVDKALLEISHNTSVILYEHAGNKYYAFTNWSKWQRVDRPSNSLLPAPTDVRRTFDEHSTSDTGTIPPNIKEVNRSKDKLIEENILTFFESVWKLYPRKEGKGQVSKSQKEKLFEIGLEEITRCIERYKKSKSGVELKFLKQGSTFFNSGYVDYLDKNYEEPPEQQSSNPFLQEDV
jgi:hypothetical protein